MPSNKAEFSRSRAPRRPQPDIIREYPVAAEAPLLEFIAAAMPDAKRTTLKNYLKYNQVMVNTTPTRQFDHQLKPGDVVKVNLTREFKVFYHRRLQIVYEDEDIIVVNKGYGLLSVGTGKPNETTAYGLLRDYVKWFNPANKIFVVHRLDRDTSGLMMFARTPQAKEAMQHNWNNMVLERKYVAVVEGVPDAEEGVVESYLAENSKFEVYSTDKPEEGQYALTRYKMLAHANGYALMELQLETGRKNQIRVHMSDLGHPIAGDRRYGAKTSPIHRLALHARTLRFAHPVTRKLMEFETPVPISFEKTVKRSR